MTHIMNPCAAGQRFRTNPGTTRNRFALPLLVLMLLPSLVFADIYRCKSDSGVITYSDEPCGENAVVAFENRAMTVEDAASRDILRSGTDRADFRAVLMDMVEHAKQVGGCILPDKEYISFTVSNPDTLNISNMEWFLRLFFGYDGHAEWQIEIHYDVRIENPHSTQLRTISAVRLKSIKAGRDRKPFNPKSMKNLKAFRKINDGEWRYER